MPNRLADSTSPYLLQHADNPVDWWEWGDAAFDEAVRRDVPVLLSVGYAACHWCHVMAHESFEDDATAAFVNSHFVAIKVDREERPDVDAVYMEAVQSLTGQGGWPMTAFLTPAGHPFYAGTYFPPHAAHGLPSFRQVLEAVSRTWAERRGEVEDAAGRIAGQLGGDRLPSAGQPPDPDRLDAAARRLATEFDAEHAGFGHAPKFPPSMVLEFLLRHHARTGDPKSLAMVEETCQRMAQGGMYDQLAGGFARYSVDRAWVVPHFEKMLYDNALLLRIYAHWWRATGSPLAKRVVIETAEFLLRDLRTSHGGFASALDADTVVDGRSIEGATYVWTPAQLVEVLGADDGHWAAGLLGVTPAGTFEHGSSTLQLRHEPEDTDRWGRVRSRLLTARQARPQPSRDDKVVAAWNGLAIAALADAGSLLERPDWVEAAVECADLLVRVHLDDHGRLARVSRDGRVGQHPGVLEDHADVAEGLLALVAATGDPVWLSFAEQLVDVVITHYPRPSGGFFDTADDAVDSRLSVIKTTAGSDRQRHALGSVRGSRRAADLRRLHGIRAAPQTPPKVPLASTTCWPSRHRGSPAGDWLSPRHSLRDPPRSPSSGRWTTQGGLSCTARRSSARRPAPPSSQAIRAKPQAMRCRCCRTDRWLGTGRLRTCAGSSSAPRRQPIRPSSRPRSAPAADLCLVVKIVVKPCLRRAADAWHHNDLHDTAGLVVTVS